ncbi:hypothetical protein EJ05DRAFT_506088 [Pseudovirgaria hyperparasitica]|uniref:Uncharacterized protein n=1 Tax=Pseudovirgaria hyperparasitica TaxID=470096 RepID=A0A6A6VR72_9PEZI|nr:uncharacterized protein EJ05DRAFT_506088 [Pseudovirgaria hyperparasitica]KAF2752389.1 hypothetical protein EJ05DRAFT_506088 [Pseudovirgaria hyperparasitica]
MVLQSLRVFSQADVLRSGGEANASKDDNIATCLLMIVWTLLPCTRPRKPTKIDNHEDNSKVDRMQTAETDLHGHTPGVPEDKSVSDAVQQLAATETQKRHLGNPQLRVFSPSAALPIFAATTSVQIPGCTQPVYSAAEGIRFAGTPPPTPPGSPDTEPLKSLSSDDDWPLKASFEDFQSSIVSNPVENTIRDSILKRESMCIPCDLWNNRHWRAPAPAQTLKKLYFQGDITWELL